MCGIIGTIGKPKNNIQSFNLTTNLLRETKRRGRHATGFYSIALNGKPFYHKAPISAEAYVQNPEWKQNIFGNIAMIGHARFTTNGEAKNNENNHPHVSKTGNIALVHNGIIFDYETLKSQYSDTLVSECDSELILRIILKERNVLEGIKKAYKLLGQAGDFACELIHKHSRTGKITFYFFRDNGRPGKMIDARETMGQLIFCSEDDIWKDSVLKAGMPRNVRQLKVSDIPEYQIVSIDADTLKIKKTKVEKPKVKTRRTYIPKYTSSYYYDDDDLYTGSYYKPSVKTTSSTNDFKNGNIKSVLSDGWTETINPETNLPRFIYTPLEEESVTFIPEDEQDLLFKDILVQALNDPEMRWYGWWDEAFSYNVIDQKQWEEFSSSKTNKG